MVLPTIRKRLSNCCICVVGVLQVVVKKKTKKEKSRTGRNTTPTQALTPIVLLCFGKKWTCLDVVGPSQPLKGGKLFLNYFISLTGAQTNLREKRRFRLLFLREKTDEAWCILTSKDESATHGSSSGIKEPIAERSKRDKSRDVKKKCQVFASEWAKYQNWYRGIREESELKAIG